MKKIYFVRHGESEGNAGLIIQGPNTPLTKRGKFQSLVIAERFAKLPIDIVISSSFERAQETARIIARITRKQIELSDLFIEWRGPRKHMGRYRDSSGVTKANNIIIDNFHIDGFRLSDEENFSDLRNRAKQALEFLKNRKEENIVVVVHGLFLRVIIAYVLFGEKLTGYECRQLIWKLDSTNTGITLIEFDSAEKDSDYSWRLRIWNDHAHLG